MQNNVVITTFAIESEAYQAFSQLKGASAGAGFAVIEAVLIKKNAAVVEVIDTLGVEQEDADTAAGFIIGSFVGVLGGPIGVIMGAATGALAGSILDEGREADAMSIVATVAGKIYEGEIAIVALVVEEEPAFDVSFAGFEAVVARYDAVDIADDVERLNELEAEICNQVLQEIKADRRAERAERREEHRANLKARFEEYEAAANRSLGFE